MAIKLKKYFFYLSGENPTIPRAEAIAVLDSIGVEYNVLGDMPQVLEVELSGYEGLKGRLALSHTMMEEYLNCESEYGLIIQAVNGADLPPLEKIEVRIKRVNDYGPDIRTVETEREIGSVFFKKGSSVDLTGPENSIIGVISERFLLGRKVLGFSRSSFSERRPHLKPYFRPGSMNPHLARAVVNLTRMKPGDRIMDPFCGTGGFLVEAGLMGAIPFGNDIDGEFVKGADKNLRYYNIPAFQLGTGDARRLHEKYPEFFDAIVTDPPYGISASTRGMDLLTLYGESIVSISGMLKPGKFACIICPDGIPLEKMGEKIGFQVREIHLERVHKSLTRKFVVFKKPSSS